MKRNSWIFLFAVGISGLTYLLLTTTANSAQTVNLVACDNDEQRVYLLDGNNKAVGEVCMPMDGILTEERVLVEIELTGLNSQRRHERQTFGVTSPLMVKLHQ